MPSLSDLDRRALLRLARQAIVDAVCSGSLPQRIPVDAIFGERSGVFVTLHVDQRLRGCIGVIEAQEPLGESVVRCAVSAALQDPRFAPMRTEELASVQIEISLLSEPAPIRAEQIELGRHGLLVARGRQRGLLLPQVAIEHRLSVDQFLQETCRKAQLPLDAWRYKDVELLGFTCEVFSEETGDAAAVGT
jgi:AmmeMemoRadiSam system protein A